MLTVVAFFEGWVALRVLMVVELLKAGWHFVC